MSLEGSLWIKGIINIVNIITEKIPTPKKDMSVRKIEQNRKYKESEKKLQTQYCILNIGIKEKNLKVVREDQTTYES